MYTCTYLFAFINLFICFLGPSKVRADRNRCKIPHSVLAPRRCLSISIGTFRCLDFLGFVGLACFPHYGAQRGTTLPGPCILYLLAQSLPLSVSLSLSLSPAVSDTSTLSLSFSLSPLSLPPFLPIPYASCFVRYARRRLIEGLEDSQVWVHHWRLHLDGGLALPFP